MAVPGAGLSLIPVDGPTRTAVAQQLACWAKQENGMTDPRIRFLSCCKLGYYYIPPEVCTAGYGDIPFTSRGAAIVCDAEEADQFDLTILASDVSPIDPNTCTTDGIQLSTPTGLAATAGDALVSLTWDAVPGAETYTVRYKLLTDGTWTEMTAAAGTTAEVTGLTNDSAYEFQVKASATGYTDSTYSASVNATPVAAGGLYRKRLAARTER
jgi:hypothetical protein